jgi:hypothetical protein
MMMWNRILSLSFFELLAAALSFTLFSLVLAFLLLACAAVVRMISKRGNRSVSRISDGASSARAQYVVERRALGVGAVGAVVIFGIEYAVRGYLLDISDTVDWWRYATPVLSAFATLAVVFSLIMLRGTVAPENPVVSTTRRTWDGFGPRTGITGVCALAIIFLATTIAAGMASSPDDLGRYIYIEIPAPNTSIDPLRPWFYGWAYGVPVIVCVAALIAVTWATLRSNALRPFLSPETSGAEKRARAEIATGAVYIAAAGMLLALGGVFRFISQSGSYSQLTIDGEGHSASYELTWRYANLAVAVGWLAPALEIAAFVLLLLTAQRLLPSRPSPDLAEITSSSSTSEAVQ